MKKGINLPFTTDLKGGSKSSFKILNDEGLNLSVKNNTNSILNTVRKMIYKNSSENSNKINYIKASSTKKYYKNIKY
jgi:hypothetical protein